MDSYIFFASRPVLQSYSRQMHRQASKKQTNKYHDRSLDDFVKHLKRYNLKSERYDRILSPDPFAPYRNNITHTLERSRTISGKHSRKTNKTTRQKVQRILSGSVSRQKYRASASKMSKTNSSNQLPNPADLITHFSKRLRDTETFLQGKSKMGVVLCRKFLEMLNEIVENMVLNLQQNLQQLQKSISERLQRQIGQRADRRVAALQRKMAKLQRETSKLLQKENYNNNLIYHLRLNHIDIDRQFGKSIFKSDQYGGYGYGKRDQSSSKVSKGSEDNLGYISNSQLIFVNRNEFQQHYREEKEEDRPLIQRRREKES